MTDAKIRNSLRVYLLEFGDISSWDGNKTKAKEKRKWTSGLQYQPASKWRNPNNRSPLRIRTLFQRSLRTLLIFAQTVEEDKHGQICLSRERGKFPRTNIYRVRVSWLTDFKSITSVYVQMAQFPERVLRLLNSLMTYTKLYMALTVDQY